MLEGEAKTPEGMRIYAIGDIHGCLRQLQDIFRQIEFDLLYSNFETYRIITIGDYVDRGPDSKGVIDFLIKAKKQHDLVCLRGNHDQRLLEFLDIPEKVGDGFLTYGGRETLNSYGIEVEEVPNFEALARKLKQAMPRSHIRFLDSLGLIHIAGDYAFVHAGVKPGVALADQSPRDLLWIRNEFIQHQKLFEKVIVHGHTISDYFDVQPNRINTDTGAFDSGILTCVVLQTSEIEKLQTSK
ncbi:MAG: metallophosphoesterase family protein [Salaquimonas sp.]